MNEFVIGHGRGLPNGIDDHAQALRRAFNPPTVHFMRPRGHLSEVLLSMRMPEHLYRLVITLATYGELYGMVPDFETLRFGIP